MTTSARAISQRPSLSTLSPMPSASPSTAFLLPLETTLSLLLLLLVFCVRKWKLVAVHAYYTRTGVHLECFTALRSVFTASCRSGWTLEYPECSYLQLDMVVSCWLLTYIHIYHIVDLCSGIHSQTFFLRAEGYGLCAGWSQRWRQTRRSLQALG